ncbi:MAG: stage II sporulation protein M [Dongiaceae bacterium]
MSEAAPAEPLVRLKSREFRRAREAGWRELEALVAVGEARGLGALSARELERMALLYRAALSALSVARSIAVDRGLLRYLEGLGLRAHLCLYGPDPGLGKALAGFFGRRLPQAVRALAWPLLVAAVLLLLGVTAGVALVDRDEAWFATLVPGSLASGRGPASSAFDLREVLEQRLPGLAETLHMVANALFANNTAVALLAFGLGFVAGVPAALLVFYQGLLLGAFVALHAHRGLLAEFLGWIAIHGVTELGALLICGAAGLRLGAAMVFPGRHLRRDELALAGRAVAPAVAGAVAMLLVAAMLEGVFRQLVQPTAGRVAIGGASLVFWLGYYLLAGRERRR